MHLVTVNSSTGVAIIFQSVGGVAYERTALTHPAARRRERNLAFMPMGD
jgi:hypothetical protein